MNLSLWSSWSNVAGSAVAAAIVYSFLILAVRLAGRRTLAQISAYDVLVTIALGSLAASTALPSDAALADGAAILLTFLGLQALIGVLRQRSQRVRRLTDFALEPVVVEGRPDLRSAVWTAQLTRADLESQLRQNGIGNLGEVRLAVLEPTGKISVTTAEELPGLFQDSSSQARPQR